MTASDPKRTVGKAVIHRAVCVSILLLLGTASAEMQPLPADLADETKKLGSTLVDSYAELYVDGARYLEFPDFPIWGYENGVAVLFYVGGFMGGNNNYQYLALYGINAPDTRRDKEKKYSLVAFSQIGGKGDRLFEQMSILKSRIYLSGFAQTEDDPMCCPSGPISAVVKIGLRGEMDIAVSEHAE